MSTEGSAGLAADSHPHNSEDPQSDEDLSTPPEWFSIRQVLKRYGEANKATLEWHDQWKDGSSVRSTWTAGFREWHSRWQQLPQLYSLQPSYAWKQGDKYDTLSPWASFQSQFPPSRSIDYLSLRSLVTASYVFTAFIWKGRSRK